MEGIASVRSMNNEVSFRSKIMTDIKEINKCKSTVSEGIKSVHETGGEGISIPQSAKIEGEIAGKSESKNDDFDSEIKDRVDSLQN
jgi:CRISPR/Cas system-associated protein Cas7 (RAMP superfamily)